MSKARDIASATPVPTTVSATELGYVDGVTSAIQTQLNSKQTVVSGVSDAEIGYLDGVTSSIQTQLNAKAVYPTQTGNSGKFLTTDGTNPSWGTVSSDLVRINKYTLSAASSINIDNCFSSTYDFYLIQFNGSVTNGGQYFNYRMRSGGTNNSSAAYSQVNIYSGYGSGTPATDGSSNQTIGSISYFRTTDKTAFEIKLRNPFAAEYTYFDTPNPDPSYTGTFSGIHAVKTSYDGITFSVGTGTITGEINIYGYKKG